ncbi:hypothetical protein Rhopal_002393-T1, partial [Rhodotorula paludigena]
MDDDAWPPTARAQQRAQALITAYFRPEDGAADSKVHSVPYDAVGDYWLVQSPGITKVLRLVLEARASTCLIGNHWSCAHPLALALGQVFSEHNIFVVECACDSLAAVKWGVQTLSHALGFGSWSRSSKDAAKALHRAEKDRKPHDPLVGAASRLRSLDVLVIHGLDRLSPGQLQYLDRFLAVFLSNGEQSRGGLQRVQVVGVADFRSIPPRARPVGNDKDAYKVPDAFVKLLERPSTLAARTLELDPPTYASNTFRAVFEVSQWPAYGGRARQAFRTSLKRAATTSRASPSSCGGACAPRSSTACSRRPSTRARASTASMPRTSVCCTTQLPTRAIRATPSTASSHAPTRSLAASFRRRRRTSSRSASCRSATRGWVPSSTSTPPRSPCRMTPSSSQSARASCSTRPSSRTRSTRLHAVSLASSSGLPRPDSTTKSPAHRRSLPTTANLSRAALRATALSAPSWSRRSRQTCARCGAGPPTSRPSRSRVTSLPCARSCTPSASPRASPCLMRKRSTSGPSFSSTALARRTRSRRGARSSSCAPPCASSPSATSTSPGLTSTANTSAWSA